MTCPSCGAWAPADPVTGYDADSLCPTCAAIEDARGFEPPEDDPRFSDDADEALFVEEFTRRGLTEVQPDLLVFASGK